AVLEILAAHDVTPSLHQQIELKEYDVGRDGETAPVVFVPRSQFDALMAAIVEAGGTVPQALRLPFGPPGTPEADARLPRRLRFDDARAILDVEPGAGGALAEPVTAPVSQIPVLWADWYAVPDADFTALPPELATRSG